MNRNSTNGFTLIELLVVVVMTGILASIAAPGWLAFINRQRLNAARDEVLQVIQSAQSKARRDNSSYEIHANSTVGSAALTVAKDINSGTSDILTGVESAIGNGSIRSKLKIEIKDVNDTNVDAFILDNKGQISYVSAPSLITQGTLPLVISTSIDGANIESRCIVVTTLLGSMVTAEGGDCDNPNYVPVP